MAMYAMCCIAVTWSMANVAGSETGLDSRMTIETPECRQYCSTQSRFFLPGGDLNRLIFWESLL